MARVTSHVILTQGHKPATQHQPLEGTPYFWPCHLKPMMRIEAPLDMELHGHRSLLYVMADMGFPQQTQNSEKKYLAHSMTKVDVGSLGDTVSDGHRLFTTF